MVHVIEKKQYFLFRTKDIHGRDLAGSFDYPGPDFYDVTVNVTLTHWRRRFIAIHEGSYQHYFDAVSSFDLLNMAPRILKNCLYPNIKKEKHLFDISIA